jgi:predicted MFS family arabinose efflux permease
VTGAPALYTPEFLRACALHFTGAMSLAMFLLFPLYVKSLGGSEATLGALLGIGTAASVAARPLVGVLLDRLGRRRILLWFGIGNVLSWVPFLFLETVGPALYVWTTVHDVMWGGLFAAYFTYAADLAPAARRAEGIAMFGIAGMSANGLAPVIGERVIDAAGYAAFFGLAMVFGTIAVGFSLAVPPAPPRGAHEPPASLRDVVTLLRYPRLRSIMLATALLGIAINAAYLFVAPFTRELGLARVGPFFAAYSATSVLIRLVGRRTLNVRVPHRVVGPGFISYGAGVYGLALMPVTSGAVSTIVLVLCGVACGAGHGSLFPVLNALALSRGPAHKQGAVVGLHTAAIDVGAVLGMPVCGIVAYRLGYPTMWTMMALACLAGLVLMARDERATGEAV